MNKLENKRMKKEKGITLIALVITIIVLLILAGVSIAMLTGPNGLLTQADEARTETDMAGAREKIQLAILGSYGEDGTLEEEKLKENLDGIPGANVGTQNLQEKNLEVELDGNTFEITKEGEVKDKGTVTPTPEGDEVIPGVIVEESNKTYIDKNKDTAVIPVGFAIVPGCEDISEGLVISDVANDINDTGNQFVWIPVESADDYKANTTYVNTSVSAKVEPDQNYLPTGVTIPEGKSEQDVERDLVTTNMLEKYEVGGFYISRYEAGKEDTNTLVSKKGANVWNNIAQNAEKAEAGQPNCKDVAKTFSVEDSTKVKSGLCTGIQWDMAMAFITKEPARKDGNGVDDYIVTEYKSTRHKGSSVGVQQSGQNEADRVCNIYDLEGNCYEYVAEKNTYDTDLPFVHRGGFYNYYYSASYRNSDGNDAASSSRSFRFVLYIM